MKNKKGFTLVELLAVIAILAILVIIALPNVLNMYTKAKKETFLTETKGIAKDVFSKYMSENMKGNNISTISNNKNPLDLSGRELEYNFEIDNQGKIKNLFVSDGTYCISTNKDYNELTIEDVSEECSYEKLHNIAGTLTKDFYEVSGRTDRSLVDSIEFYSDGRTIEGAESYDVSEKKDDSIKMYVSKNSTNSLYVDLTIVANGKIAFPKNSTGLFDFTFSTCIGPISNLKNIKFNNSIDTSRVQNMSYMFFYVEATTLDLSSFDTSNVTDMSYMFAFSQATTLDVRNFDTSKVTNMGSMFFYSKATALDLSNFDTSNVTNMYGMFNNPMSPICMKIIYNKYG